MHKLPTFKICAQKAQVNHETAVACYNGRIENGFSNLPLALSLAKECQDTAKANLDDVLAEIQQNGLTNSLINSVATIYGVKKEASKRLLTLVGMIDEVSTISGLSFDKQLTATFTAKGIKWQVDSCFDCDTLKGLGQEFKGGADELVMIVKCLNK